MSIVKPCPSHLLPGTVLGSKSYGKFKITKYVSRAEIHLMFIKTGFETVAKKRSIENGFVRDPFFPRIYGVGFIGVGDYQPKENDALPYRAWHYMLRRCYGEGFLERGDSVCEEWKNFQNFAGWYNENKKPGKILMNKEGEHVYSPVNSLFDNRDNNSRFLSGVEYKVKSPEGKIFKLKNVAKFCREHGLRAANLNVVINGKQKQHRGWVSTSMPEEERKSLCTYKSNGKRKINKIEPVKPILKQGKEEDRFKPRTQKIVPNKLSETDVLLNKFFGIG